MSEESKVTQDDNVVDDSTDLSLAANTGDGLRAGLHDQNTIFQQNNAQINSVLESIVQMQREQTAQFEMRMREQQQQFQQTQRQQDQMFQTTMQAQVANQDAANGRANATTQQQQSYTNQQAQQSRAAATAEHYADVGAITIIP